MAETMCASLCRSIQLDIYQLLMCVCVQICPAIYQLLAWVYLSSPGGRGPSIHAQVPVPDRQSSTNPPPLSLPHSHPLPPPLLPLLSVGDRGTFCLARSAVPLALRFHCQTSRLSWVFPPQRAPMSFNISLIWGFRASRLTERWCCLPRPLHRHISDANLWVLLRKSSPDTGRPDRRWSSGSRGPFVRGVAPCGAFGGLCRRRRSTWSVILFCIPSDLAPVAILVVCAIAEVRSCNRISRVFSRFFSPPLCFLQCPDGG